MKMKLSKEERGYKVEKEQRRVVRLMGANEAKDHRSLRVLEKVSWKHRKQW